MKTLSWFSLILMIGLSFPGAGFAENKIPAQLEPEADLPYESGSTGNLQDPGVFQNYNTTLKDKFETRNLSNTQPYVDAYRTNDASQKALTAETTAFANGASSSNALRNAIEAEIQASQLPGY